MTKAEKIGEFVKNISFEKIPRTVIEKAKDQVLGVLGALYAGSQTLPAKIIKKCTIENFNGDKSATIFPSGEKTSIKTAVYINAVSTIALDYVDYLFAAHTGVSSVNTALALGEHFKINGKEFLTSIILGNEIAGRVGASAIIGPLNGQALSFVHLGSSACITGRLLGLSEEQIANSLGIAYTIPTTCTYRGIVSPMAKVLIAAVPTKLGIEAAYLAKDGFTGALDIFEHPIGWCNFNADLPLPHFIDISLGSFWVTETICYKMYPGCAYLSPVADAITKIFQKNPDLDYHNIESIEVSGQGLMTFMDDLFRPFVNLEELKRTKSHVALNFSIPYSVAVMLIDKELTPAQFAEKRILDPEVHQLAKRVHISVDLGLTSQTAGIFSVLNVKMGEQGKELKSTDAERFRMYFGAKMIIKMKDGKKYRAKETEPIGTPGNPYPIENKFKQEAKAIKIPEDQILKIIETVQNIEKLKDINDLISLLSIS